MPATNSREQEAKFAIPSDTFPSLSAQPIDLDGYTQQIVGMVDHLDTYLDTPAFELLRHGIALRVRRSGAHIEVGIKSIHAKRKGVIQDRAEVTIMLDTQASPLDATTWPDAVHEQLAPYAVKLTKLRPVLVMRQQRQKSILSPTTDSTPFAEWSVDAVWLEDRTSVEPLTTGDTAQAQDEAAQVARAQPTFHEFEIELLASGTSEADESEAGASDASIDATNAAFATLVRTVQTRLDLTALATSKFVRGLEAKVATTHGNNASLTATMTLAQAGRLLLHQQMLQILLNEHGVRNLKSPRYVHDMRVAIRRGRAAIHLCHHAFPDESLDPLEAGLKRLGRALGSLRDLDVARANLRDFARSQPDSVGKGVKMLRAELRNRRKQAHAELLALLNSKQQRRFITKFLRFCASPAPENEQAEEASARVAPTQVRHTLPSLIHGAFEAVRAYETVITPTHTPPLETFHALRIQAKYLRYLIEFAHHLMGDEGMHLADSLRELQESLGELNDAHVEQNRLQLWAEALANEESLHLAIEARLRDIDTTIAALVADAPAKLATLTSLPTREMLGMALAKL